MSVMTDFNLPKEIVGAYWNSIKIIGPSIERTWTNPEDLGVVFHFDKLREFLATEAQRNGADVLLDTLFISFEETQDEVTVHLSKDAKQFTVRCKILVDATGATRDIIEKIQKKPLNYINGRGIEYLIETSKLETYRKKLAFYLGPKWAPGGYAWIFPMNNNQYKVGIGILELRSKPQLQEHLLFVIENDLKLTSNDYKIIEKHSGTLSVPIKKRELYGRKCIIGVGDSISMLNPLGGEGIRHAMRSGNISSKHILKYLENPKYKLTKKYTKDINGYKGLRYPLTKIAATTVYAFLTDAEIDHGVDLIKVLSIKEILAILFEYKFQIGFKHPGLIMKFIKVMLLRYLFHKDLVIPINRNNN